MVKRPAAGPTPPYVPSVVRKRLEEKRRALRAGLNRLGDTTPPDPEAVRAQAAELRGELDEYAGLVDAVVDAFTEDTARGAERQEESPRKRR